ncbi:RidA family protein [Sphingosinicella rhizophila]|uniref:RidA family protein n=1 Tax=Sphingosinicella rhizophila TaxID=3050082 RepID=A0ABU3Q4I2_9SPHN|nr:RidA family protein [Sphingosinicella sp. GR2756]MDT9598329.1 RidA family protein [Sphingosinicella sp. GR2756]
MKTLLPSGWQRPKGYANGISARGRTILTAGVVGWNSDGVFASGIAGQFRQLLLNILAILAEDEAGPEHVVRMTWYIVSRDDYVANLGEIGAIYRELMGRNFPAMAVVQVAGLVEPEALIEIETTAMVPD